MSTVQAEVNFLRTLNELVDITGKLAQLWEDARSSGVPEATLIAGYPAGFKDFDEVWAEVVNWRNEVHKIIYQERLTVSEFRQDHMGGNKVSWADDNL